MHKRILASMMLLLLFIPLGAASFTGGIPVREKLFYSEEELSKVDFTTPLTEGEREYYEDTHIYITTAAPSDPVYIFFGHAGIEVDTPDTPPVMFDYGTFRFDNTFYINFALGRLYYNVIESYSFYRYEEFQMDDRTVKRIELDLTPEEKKAVIGFLSYNILPENDTYLYHYYKDNCATRLRDIYNAATGGAFREWCEKQETGKGFRAWSLPYMHPSFFFAFILNYLQGPLVDEPVDLYEACFLPDILLQTIEEYEGKNAEIIYQTKSRPDTPDHYDLITRSFIAGLAISILILLTSSKKKWISRIGDLTSGAVYLFLGVMSLVLLFMMTMTNHDVTYGNTNIIVISPFVLALAAMHLASLGKKERRKGLGSLSKILLISVLSLLALKGCLIDILYEDNIAYFVFIIPLYAAEVLVSRMKAKAVSLYR